MSTPMLPVTGSVMTTPLAIVGLALTAGGWLLRKLGRDLEEVEAE